MADGQEASVPGFPRGAEIFALEKFAGLNTKAARQSIEDQESSWLENFMPIGEGNCRTMWGQGDSIYTAAVGKTIIFHFFYNIGSTQYAIVFLDDGTAYQVNVNTMAVTTVSSTANTFYDGGALPACRQWGIHYLLIVGSVNTNSYWVWDGAVLYGSGTISPVITITNAGTGYTSAPSVTFSSGAAAATATVTSGSITKITVTNPGSGYTTAPTIGFSGGGGSGAAATATLMPSGVSGTAIETYQSRVWIENGENLTFSAPGSFSDFSTTNGGGTVPSTDGFLRQKYVQIRQSNGFLYTFGDSSINSISNVQTTGSPASTTFNNLNADPQVGTPWAGSVVEFGRALMLANTSGIYTIFGGAAEKVSDKLDGLFDDATLPLTGATLPTGAVATIFGIKVFILLIPGAVDYLGVARPLMAIWDGRKFFIGSQESDLLSISTQEVLSNLTAWGTDGTDLFPLFQTPNDQLQKIIQSKLWGGKSYLINKQALRGYLQIQDNSGGGVDTQLDIDSEVSSATTQFTASNIIQFVNNSNQPLQFQNNSNQDINFTIPGDAIIGNNVSLYGQLLGLTATTFAEDATLVSASILYKDYRGLY